MKKFFYISVLILWSFSLNAESRRANNNNRPFLYRGITSGNNLTDQDLTDLGGWGVNVLRYALAWHVEADTADETEYFDWLDAQLDRVETVLPVAEAAGYRIVLQLFTPPGGFVRGESGAALHSIFVKPWAKRAYLKAWDIIAKRFKGDSRILAYHLLNEPAQKRVNEDLLAWPELANEVINQIKKIDSTVPLIVDAVYGNPSKIGQLSSLKQKGLIFGFNLYLPYDFVKQGLPGFKSNIKYPSARSNRSVIEDRLGSVYRFQKRTNAPIWVGEFSVTRWTDPKSATKYLKDVISIFEKNRWSWTYHIFRESDAWDLELSEVRRKKDKADSPTKRLQVMLKAWAKNKLPKKRKTKKRKVSQRKLNS